jgi:hypothetical protein
MGSQKQPLPGIVLISGSYCLGIASLVLSIFLNSEKVGDQIADIHGIPALAGIPILILTIIISTFVAIGLYRMTPWGYWLTLIYVCYLLIIPTILAGRIPSLIGNITWPLTVSIYLVLRRNKYFGITRTLNKVR